MLRTRKAVKRIYRNFNNERGSTLLTVLIIMLIFAVIGSAVLITSANNLNISQRMSEYEDTYYMAEANAQYALTFVKEEVTKYYMELQAITADKKWEYIQAMKEFYPSIIKKVSTSDDYASTCEFTPLDFSDEGVNTTVNITIDTDTPLPTSDFGEEGNAVRFLIESIAESEKSRRVVNAVLVLDDPDVDWDMTSAPPMTDMRMLIGNEIVLTDDWNAGEYNSIFCRGSALIAYSFVDQFLEDHQEFLNTYTYDFSNAVPKMLKWDLQYDKFPTHDAFETFESMFEASTNGTNTYDVYYDWRNRTIDYNIPWPAPLTYPNADIIDSSVDKDDVDFYYTQSTWRDTMNYTTTYEGTVDDPVRIYAVRDIELSGRKNIKNCYIYAERDIEINIRGYMENVIIISNQGYIEINCNYIVNSTHSLIKAKYDLDIIVDVGALIKNVVGVSKYGGITIDHDSSNSAYKKKLKMYNCYLYTNKDDRDGMIYLRNVYSHKSFYNAGKDLILRNCSGRGSGYYAHGYTDSDLNSSDKYYKLYLGNYYNRRYVDYNYYMQYRVDRSYYRRYMRGIIIISELPELGLDQEQYENVFITCDFTTNESIFVSDPRYDASYSAQIVDLQYCRIIAAREVLIEDVKMFTCYTFAGIRGYENEQEYYYYWGTYRLYAVRGIYMRMDHSHNDIRHSVFYSRGRMMYSQHTPDYQYPISEHGKKRVYDSFFYSINNFDYNGTSTTEGLDTTVMRNDSDLCNDMIIMTESNLGPHEFSPSIANDVVFIGGSLELDPDRPHWSGKLENIIGEEKIGEYGIDNSIDVQTHILYENYFEQLLDLDEIQRNSPTFGDVFIFEDIYEKTEAEMEGS